MNIGRLTGKRGPAERAAAFAEKRANVSRHEAGKIVSVLHALLEREGADIVAVIKSHRAHFLQREHRFHVARDGIERALFVGSGIGLAHLSGLRYVQALRNVSADGIVRAGLIGEQVGHDAAARELGNYVRAISSEPHGSGFALAHGIFQNAEGFVEVVDHHVAVARFHAALDAFGVHIDSQERRAVQGCGQRLRATHPPHATGHD